MVILLLQCEFCNHLFIKLNCILYYFLYCRYNYKNHIIQSYLTIVMLVVLLLFISLTATGNCQCSQQLVNNINRLGTTWRAQTSFPTGQMPDVCGTMDPGKIPMQKVQLMSTIPSEFDARVKWSHCQTMNLIRNQGRCGSCWV